MITEEEIDAAKTPAGGFTRATLEGWGVPWPPKKGWKAKLIAEGNPPHKTSPDVFGAREAAE